MHEENGESFYYNDKNEKIYGIKPLLGQEPTFPVLTWEYDGQGNVLHSQSSGMSKRLVIASMAMQGILTHNGFYWQGNGTMENLNGVLPSHAAELSFQYADALLKQDQNG
jgi:hypothetical protein